MNLEAVFVGESAEIKKLRKDILRYAEVQQPLLVKGERGTGRGLFARLLYEVSSSKGKLFTVDPRTVEDNELADLASEIVPTVSFFLFRDMEDFSCVQQLCIRRFIESVLQESSARIIVTVMDNITTLYKEKKLPEEMFELLKGFDLVSIPTLMQRQSDVALLIEHFIVRTCENLGIPRKSVDANTLDFLMRHEWKGNVRELKLVIERAIVNASDQFIELPKTLIDEYAQLDGIVTNIDAKNPFSFDKSLYNLEKTLIERTLKVVGFNQCNAAEILALSEANLRYRLKKFHIPTAKEKT
jgi:two-component system response regulator PilR (NtrC family)